MKKKFTPHNVLHGHSKMARVHSQSDKVHAIKQMSKSPDFAAVTIDHHDKSPTEINGAQAAGSQATRWTATAATVATRLAARF
jgi:hypothetical protein